MFDYAQHKKRLDTQFVPDSLDDKQQKNLGEQNGRKMQSTQARRSKRKPSAIDVNLPPPVLNLN